MTKTLGSEVLAPIVEQQLLENLRENVSVYNCVCVYKIALDMIFVNKLKVLVVL